MSRLPFLFAEVQSSHILSRLGEFLILHNSVSMKKLVTVIGLILVAVTFQNCGSSSWQQFQAGLEKLKGNGNGQGYPGKVNGTFASIDTTNSCGLNSANTIRIKDKIQINDDKMSKVVENCQTLSVPIEMRPSQITLLDSSQQLLVLDERLYQSGSWTDGTTAPVGQFKDLFCTGVARSGTRIEVSLSGGLFSKSRPDEHGEEESAANLTGAVSTISPTGTLSNYLYSDFKQDWHGDDSLEVQSGERIQIRFDSFKLPGPFRPDDFKVNLPTLDTDSFSSSSCWVPF